VQEGFLEKLWLNRLEQFRNIKNNQDQQGDTQ
jgi:hypothetical protein